jgi:ubiquinone/menaquinone biosynthesis C-methylase UbiE
MSVRFLDFLRNIVGLRHARSRSVSSVGTSNHSTRVEWVKLKLRALPPGTRLLDAGAGEMQFKDLCSHLEYVSQDFDKYDGKGDGAGLQMGRWSAARVDIVSDITDVPAADASFDAILCTEVLEHLPEPVLAFKEFSRLLRARGDLIMTAPFNSLTHFAPYHFYTGFNRYFYEHHLPKLGFDVVEITENGNFFEFLGQELHRIPEVATKYCSVDIPEPELRHIDALLELLERLSRDDRGSKELLNFDLQVHAKKR